MIQQLNDGISRTLYEISSVLLLPVMLAVLACFIASLALLGGFVREARERRRTRMSLDAAIRLVNTGEVDPSAVWKALLQGGCGLPLSYGRAVQTGPGSPAFWRKCLSDLESRIAVSLGRVSFLARVGPMLGLLGTLIPFGPALSGLSSGDIQTLSANLVTAFATTVVGLLCGSIAYGLGTVRRAWYGRDYDDIEYVVQLISEVHSLEVSKSQEVGGNGRRSDLRTNQLV
ncbi:MotA/TolQ/ExbB proton channel family protein [Humisphaera borealis]|uniref:MotA/TolQ/ExbB proton channel family protein n=1 Tax=Humisphaera borealis TaxID=2807512 RepID=UPI0019CF670B|nr:MotA/TolQ/ExbB proton channel family protein [Humisphaera borealis]